MAELVGILNITPDSFSDGGNYFNPNAALEHMENMVNEGANIIDIGAESTRPNATPLLHEQEWQRLEPILKATEGWKTKISVDTRHAKTAQKSLELGVEWINDVSGCSDPDMIRVIANCPETRIVIMHNMGVPANPENVINQNINPVEKVFGWGIKKIEELEEHGISKQQIIFDPGIGFGKTAKQSLALVKEAEVFKKLDTEIMIGHSRKSFLTVFSDKPANQRDEETFKLSAELSKKHIEYLRVHNISGNLQAIGEI